jgi:hypothetical protein
LECEREFNADYIVTRDLPGFANTEITVIFPDEFIKNFENSV